MNMQNNRTNPFNDYGSTLSKQPPVNNNPNRTPIDSYYLSSQGPKPKKQYGMFSRRYLPKDNISAINRSRVTQNQNMTTSYTGMLSEQKLYSQEMLFLLSEEQNNLKYFKEKIQGEKTRVLRDFQNLKRQVQHVIDDMHISFVAQLDLNYKQFINRYKMFKQYMVNLRQIRRNLMNQMPPEQNDYLAQLNQSKNNAMSNRDLLSQIEKDAQLFRNQKIYSQITDMQKQNIQPARELAAEIVAMGGVEVQYYNEGQCSTLFKIIIEAMQREIKPVYEEIRDKYIKSADMIICELQNGRNQNILGGLTEYDNNGDDYYQENGRDKFSNFKSADHRDIIKSFNSPAQGKRPESRQPRNDLKPLGYGDGQSKKYTRPVSSSSDFQGIGTISKQSKAAPVRDRQDDYSTDKLKQGSQWKSSRNYHMGNLKQQQNRQNTFRVGLEQQNICAEWIQDINMREVGVIQANQNIEAMLCGIFACDGKVIVVGGKDKVLRVYEVSSGKMLCVLNGHLANICSLANHGPLISSGGDHGCSSLILWDTKSWTIRSKVQLHTAAVTCIVDMQDGTHLATASYDRKINIFSYRRGAVVFTINSSKTGISCMGLSSDGHRLISASLDSSMAIWKITRENNNIINLQAQKQFILESLVCSLRPLSLKSNYFMVGTKDGKMQMINCLTGETVRRMAIGSTPIVQLLLLQRQNKPQSPLALTCCPKQKSLILSKTQTGVNSLIDVRGRLNVQIGCGIGPKVVISDSGLVGIVSQSSMNKQILLYQLTLL